jgi:rhodanese-related sulfurtransferase
MTCLSDLLKLAQQRARDLNLPFEGACTPREAQEIWRMAPGAKLIDVRTRAELDWVGRIPGAIEIEWQAYPGNKLNEHFISQLRQSVDRESLLLFICRSGQRSSSAAKAATEAGFADCYNVLEGFEGDKDAAGQRNRVGGWRFHGLPWAQT